MALTLAPIAAPFFTVWMAETNPPTVIPMSDIARALQVASDAIYANDQFSARQASLAAELAIKALDEAGLLDAGSP
jgi:hypothetical protein